MINEESQKQLLNYLEKIQSKKKQQFDTLKNFKNYSDTLNRETQNSEKQMDAYFEERNQEISELNNKLQLAIQQNNKESIVQITAQLGGMK